MKAELFPGLDQHVEDQEDDVVVPTRKQMMAAANVLRQGLLYRGAKTYRLLREVDSAVHLVTAGELRQVKLTEFK